MSRESDNDNRSNQLNPNNAEYWNCRAEGSRGSATDDYYDEPERHQPGWSGLAHASNFEQIKREQHYFAATTFDGTAVYVRFVTEVQLGYFAGSQRTSYLAELAKESLLGFMQRRCPLGVAYWRLATDESRGEFYWYTSRFSFNDRDERERVLRWDTAVRDQSQQLDLLFDWGKHDRAADLGVIKDEMITFAPESDDLLKWRKQRIS
jgi:hypothetical protein